MKLPTLGQMLFGTEGLALLRLAATDDAAARDARVAEIRALLGRYDADLAAPLDTAEYGIDAGYHLWSQTYDSPLRLFPVEEPVVRSLLQPLHPCHILDAAYGTGRHAEWLAAQGHGVVGVDVSPAMLARARAKIPSGRFENGDLTALPQPDASVEVVLCTLALVHLAEFARVVRPGGRIVISDVHRFLVTLGWQAQFRIAAGGTGFVRLHRHLASGYARAAVEAGLSVVSLHEPLLTVDSAVTVAQGPIPAANAAAWAGLPGVIVWELAKPAAA